MKALDTLKKKFAELDDERLARKHDELRGKRNELARADLLQDVLVEVDTTLREFRENPNTKSWLRGIIGALRASVSEKGNVALFVGDREMRELVFQFVLASPQFGEWVHERVENDDRYSSMEPSKRDAAVAKLDAEIASLNAEIRRREIVRAAAEQEAQTAADLAAVGAEAGE